MNFSLETSRYCWVLGIPKTRISISKDEVFIQSLNDSIKINLIVLPRPPNIQENLFFSSFHIDEYTFRGFSKKEVKNFVIECEKAWYVCRLPPLIEFKEKAIVFFQNKYVRSSKYKIIRDRALELKESYIKHPEPYLLSKKQEEIFSFIESISTNEEYLKLSRNNFINFELERFKAFFDSVESNPLTPSQRKACVVDNDANLILAGAGTGKTSTMVGKAGYLVKSGKAKPEEILMLAFGKKAQVELQKRINEKLNLSTIKASTFHALGNMIVSEVNKGVLIVSELANDQKKLKKFVNNSLETLLKEKQFRNKAITYFDKYLYPDKNPF